MKRCYGRIGRPIAKPANLPGGVTTPFRVSINDLKDADPGGLVYAPDMGGREERALSCPWSCAREVARLTR